MFRFPSPSRISVPALTLMLVLGIPVIAFPLLAWSAPVSVTTSNEERMRRLENDITRLMSDEEAMRLRLTTLEAQNSGTRIGVLENNVGFIVRLLEATLAGILLQLSLQFFRLVLESKKTKKEDE